LRSSVGSRRVARRRGVLPELLPVTVSERPPRQIVVAFGARSYSSLTGGPGSETSRCLDMDVIFRQGSPPLPLLASTHLEGAHEALDSAHALGDCLGQGFLVC